MERTKKIFSEYFVKNSIAQIDFANVTVNETNLSETELIEDDSFYLYEHEQLAMLWILFTCIVVGNCIVLLALSIDKTRTNRFNFFIRHLAVADLSVGFVSVLTDIVWKLTIGRTASNAACKTIRYSQAAVTYASIYLLVALTIDRYYAIIFPMSFFKSWRRAKILVIGAWILSFTFAVPISFLYEVKLVNGRKQCWIEFTESWQWQTYMILLSLSVFIVPAFIIGGCYTAIICKIWSHAAVPQHTPTPRRGNRNQNRGAKDRNYEGVSSQGLFPRAKVKTVKMTLTIVFVFVSCWSPYIIFDLLQVFGYIKRTQSNVALATFIQSLAPLNSAMNPVIFCLFSSYICRNRRALRAALSPYAKYCCCIRIWRSFRRMRRNRDEEEPEIRTRRDQTSTTPSSQAIPLRHLSNLDIIEIVDETAPRPRVQTSAF